MHRLSFLFAIAISLSAGAAQAAPQILGLVATGPEPTVLHCSDGVCSARFTSFCLQADRDAPLLGTEYLIADERSLQLVVRGMDGRVTSVPAEGATIQSVNNYTAVQINVPEAQIRALGGATAALSVAPLATLVPKAIPGDPRPQSEEDIALASGDHRKIGEDHVDRGGATADAASTLMTMINSLDPDVAGQQRRRDVAAETDVIKGVLAERGVPVDDKELLRERVDLCAGLVANAWYRDGMPTCLQTYHDNYVSTLTGRYWDAVGTGY
ncbi:MAG: hypothetical protein GEU87_11215 [Alphaproteobacteria bacterium]|nr:hypothetical protein [Alphaproteobacteria bacterium]